MTEEEYKQGKIGLEQYYLDLSDDHFRMLLSLNEPKRWREVDAQVATAIWLKQHDIGNKMPTREQLVKALKLLADYGGYAGYTDEKNAEVIIQHWNDEECDDEQW